MPSDAQARAPTILSGCAVRGVETAGGRISFVVTEHGRISCSAVLVAAGAWSRLFCGNLSVEVPQLKVLNSVLRTTPLDAPLPHTAWAGDFAFRKRVDGGFTVADGLTNIAEIVPDSFRLFRSFAPALMRERKSLRLKLGRRFIEEARLPRYWKLDGTSPFEMVRTLNPAPDFGVNQRAFERLRAAFPVFQCATILQHWAGLIDVTPDAIPIISAVDSRPGLFLATGFSGHGFGIGPSAGFLAADLIMGGTTSLDPAPFRLARSYN